MSTASPPPLWLCLRFPRLPLDIYLHGMKTANQGRAIAIVHRQRIEFACPVAAAVGVQRNMSVANACMLAPELVLVERNPVREEAAFARLVQWAYRFTPAVTPVGNDGLLLEIGGCLSLFRGLPNLLARVDRGLAQLGFQQARGLAHTPAAARLLSFVPDVEPTTDPERFMAQLRAAPLHHLELNDRQSKQLTGLGLRTLGELLQLPAGSIGKRFGRDFMHRLQRITGERPDPQQAVVPAEAFVSDRYFPGGLIRVPMIAAVARELLTELHRFLRHRQLHCHSFDWHFVTTDRQRSQLQIALAQPHNQLTGFIALTELKLEGHRFDAPVETVQLRCSAITPAAQYSGSLFGGVAESIGEHNSGENSRGENSSFLLDKIVSRLGKECLYTLACADEHLPELRFEKRGLGLMLSDGSDPGSRPAPSRLRGGGGTAKRTGDSTDGVQRHPGPELPLWLNETPIALRRRQGEPVYQGGLTLVNGPLRIDSHWWQRRRQRDYFIARHSSGAHYWIFFDRKTGEWYLHGGFG